jgi:predicted PurR-regulated permease PerM
MGPHARIYIWPGTGGRHAEPIVTDQQQSWTGRALASSAAVSWRALVCAVIIAVAAVALIAVRNLVLGVAFGILGAAVVAPLAHWLARHRVPPLLAAAVAALTLILALGAVALLLLGTVVQE